MYANQPIGKGFGPHIQPVSSDTYNLVRWAGTCRATLQYHYGATMRLLNTQTQVLKDHNENCPEYAILSHMWGDGEVTFDDIDKPHARSMAGYSKILNCCKQALKDGFEWVWIDTCCIDKNSSAELTEAINSMYQWYWQAETCYAYLADVKQPLDSSIGPFHSDFVRSRWFRRGWTLQELLAPPSVVFFDQNWNYFGTKHDMYMIIKRASGIDEKHIRQRETIREASIGTVFGWASKRETKRPEDVAYCLLGFFRVSMPLLYGEGTRAFYRLQLELLRQTEDHTIFAWDPQEGEVYETMGILAPSHRHRASLWVTDLTPTDGSRESPAWTSTIKEGFKRFRRHVEDLKDHEQYTRVHKTWHVPPNIVVSLRASKTRTFEHGGQWSVAIRICDAKWGIVRGDLDCIKKEIQACLEDSPLDQSG